MLVDTHCHIYLEQFNEDLRAVLDRAAEAGVGHIFMPAINYDSLEKMEKLSHPEITFHKMAGIHPTEINDGISTDQKELMDYCSRDEIVAVGETGLDYYWSDDYKEEQQKNLRLHCEAAKAVGKPVILHNRDSTRDLLDIIEEQQDGSLSGIWHCFNGTEEEGRRAIYLGLFLGIGGVATFKNAGVDETVVRLPLEKMVLETDAPYLSPEPHRGKRNEPAFVRDTAKRLADIMGCSLEEIEQVTSERALSFFNCGE